MRLVCWNFSTIRTWHSPSSQRFAWPPELDISHASHAKYTEGGYFATSFFSVCFTLLDCAKTCRVFSGFTYVGWPIHQPCVGWAAAAYTWRTHNCKSLFQHLYKLILTVAHASNLVPVCSTDEEDSSVRGGKTTPFMCKMVCREAISNVLTWLEYC